MITSFKDNETEAQINTVLAVSSNTKYVFSYSGIDTKYPGGAVTAVVFDVNGNVTGYRTAVASLAAGKTYIKACIAISGVSAKTSVVTLDDGQGVQYTAAQVTANW